MNARNAGVAMGGCDWGPVVVVDWGFEIGGVGGEAMDGGWDFAVVARGILKLTLPWGREKIGGCRELGNGREFSYRLIIVKGCGGDGNTTFKWTVSMLTL